MSLYSWVPRLGAISMSTAEPSGWATATQRPPDPNLASKARIESKLAQIEAQAAILVSDVDVDGVDSEVRLGRRRVAIASEYMPVAPSAGCGSGKVPRYGNVQIWTLKQIGRA